MTSTNTTRDAMDRLRARLREGNHEKLWQQIGGDDVPVLDTSVEDAEPKRTRKRRPSLATALAQAAKAGLTVSGANIAPDGSVSLTFGDGSTTMTNPWDEVLNNAAH